MRPCQRTFSEPGKKIQKDVDGFPGWRVCMPWDADVPTSLEDTMKTLVGILGAGLLTTGMATAAEVWTSVDALSSVAFGSVKKDVVGEVHTFSDVKGSVDETGAVAVDIDLASVETFIDIRNERMMKYIFDDGKATAVLNGAVDMDDLNALAVGDIGTTDFEGTLTFAGIEADVYVEMMVARLKEDRVLVTTSDFTMLSTADLGIDPGIDKLMELAELPGITRVTPVTIRMVFEK
jgi:hypothetical protein